MAKERVVIVGAGGISNAWFPVMAAEKVEIAGVVDLRIDAARGQIAKYALACEASTDLDATLKKTSPDIVVDLTVPEAHCEVTCRSLRAGCHVIGEKPMASSLAEARRMVRTAEKTGNMYMVSQSRRWDAAHDVVQKSIARGKIGQVTTVNCDFFMGCHFGGFREEMPSPLILDMAIHHFDLARFMTGADPVAVYAHEFNPKGSWYAGDVSASCIFEMTDGVVFTYRGSWCADGPGTSWNGDWRILGDGGTLIYERDEDPSIHVPKAKMQFSRELRTVKTPARRLKYRGMRGAMREMLAYVRKGVVPQSECHDNIKSLAMVFAAIESSKKGRRVNVRAL